MYVIPMSSAVSKKLKHFNLSSFKPKNIDCRSVLSDLNVFSSVHRGIALATFLALENVSLTVMERLIIDNMSHCRNFS